MSTPVDENGNPIAQPPAVSGESPPVARSIPVDENGNSIQQSNWLGTAERVGARIATAPADFWAGATQGLGSYLESKGIGGPTPTLLDNNGQQLTGPGAPRQPLPSEALIHGIGADAPTGMPWYEKAVESAAPFLLPNANTAMRVAEAPSLIGKGIALAGSTAMGGVDWAGANAAQEVAREHGASPLVQTLASMATPAARGAAFRTAGGIAHGLGGAEEAGPMFDLYKGEGQMPPLSEVASPKALGLQNWLGNVSLKDLPMLGGYLFGPAAGKVALGLTTGARAAADRMNDPSVIRAFAGRGNTAPLLDQYYQRTGLAAAPQDPSPVTQTILGYAR